MNKFLNCEEILDGWKIKKLELFEFVKQGLQPYSSETGKPIPSSHTMQRRLRSIKWALNVVKKYQKSPTSLTREEEDWLLDYGASPEIIIDECLKEQKLIKSKMKKMNLSKGYTDDSWKYFHLLSTEKHIKWVIDDLFKKALFLKNEIEEFLGPEKSYNLKDSSAKQADQIKVNTKDNNAGVSNLDKINSLIKAAAQEAEILYKAKLEIRNKKIDYEKKIKSSVLKKYDENEDFFEIIQRSDLQFDEIYILTETNEKRDFVGKLFQKVISRHGIKAMGITKIYKIFNDVKSKK